MAEKKLLLYCQGVFSGDKVVLWFLLPFLMMMRWGRNDKYILIVDELIA